MMRRVDRRSGHVLIAVLVCVSLMLTSISVGLRHAIQTRSEVRKHLLINQTILLSEAGLRRGYQGYRCQANYQGEEWCPEIPEHQNKKAVVTIRIYEDATMGRILEATAVLQSQEGESIRIQRTARITLNQPLSQSDSTKTTQEAL